MKFSRRLSGRVFALLVALLALGAGAAAQTALRPAEKPPEKPAGTFVSRESVTVTNIDVVVQDSKGNRVTGLKKSDFIVIEDGLEQPVTNFFAVEQGRMTVVGEEEDPSPAPGAPAAAPAPAPPAGAGAVTVAAPKVRIVIFVDNLSLQPGNRNRVFRKLEEWVRESVKGETEAMIVVWNHSLKIRRKFTNDGRDLSDILKQIEEESGLGSNRASSRRDLIKEIDDSRSASEATASVRSWANEYDNDLKFTFDAMKSTINNLAGIEGRKIMIHISDGLPQSPGAEMWKYISEKYRQDSTALMNNFEYDKTSQYIAVIQAANAAGVTLYTIDAAGLSVDSNISAENRGLSQRIDVFVEQNNLTAPLQLMAEETGGEAIINRNDVTGPLKQIEADYTSYYSLGYRSLRTGLDRPHKVVVKLRSRKGATVRARGSYVEKGLETKTTEAVMSGLYFAREDNPLAVGLEVGQPVPVQSGNFSVPVRIRIPYSRIAMLPDGKNVRGRLTFYFVVMDALEMKSDLSTQNKTIEIDAKRFEELEKKDFIYDVQMLMIPGRQRLSLAIRDDTTNQTSFMQQNVFVSVFSGQSPAKK